MHVRYQSVSGAPREQLQAFSLLLMLTLMATAGAAVISGQIILHQRLRAVERRNRLYQQQVATDAGVLQVLAAGMLNNESAGTNAVVRIPQPLDAKVTVAWETLPASEENPDGSWRLRASLDNADEQAAYRMEYMVRFENNRWIMVRWPENTE